MLIRTEFNGSPYLGVFARANDATVLAPSGLTERTLREVGDALEVEVVTTTLGGSNILGAVVVLNNHGAVVADFATEAEVERLRATGLEVERLPGRFNAAGNNILANDHGALVNPEFRRPGVRAVEDALDVPAEKGTVAGLNTVGSAACATTAGALCHPKTTDEELEFLEEVLGVEADIGTVNHGAPYIGAGLVANANGAAIGRQTTGPELNRIEDALRYI